MQDHGPKRAWATAQIEYHLSTSSTRACIGVKVSCSQTTRIAITSAARRCRENQTVEITRDKRGGELAELRRVRSAALCWVTTQLSQHDLFGCADNLFLLSHLCSSGHGAWGQCVPCWGASKTPKFKQIMVDLPVQLRCVVGRQTDRQPAHSPAHPHSRGTMRGTELIVRGHRGRSERLTDACVYHRGCSRAGKDLARGGGGAGGRARGAAAITMTVARMTAARTTVGRLQQG